MQENAQLKQREDGDTFNPKTSTPREITAALVGALAPYRGKAEKVWHELGALVKPKKGKTVEAESTEPQP